MGKRNQRWMAACGCLLLVAACGGGGGGEGDGDAGGPLHPDMVPVNAWNVPAPDYSIEIKPAEFAEGLENGTLALVTPEDAVREEAALRTRLVEDQARAEELYASTPDLLARLTTDPAPSDPGIEALPDGNWRVRMGGAAGAPIRHVTLMGRRHAYRELITAREQDRSRDNQAGLYRMLYARLSREQASRLGLPDPDDTGGYAASELKDEIHKIGLGWSTYLLPSGGKPPGYPTNAGDEEGHGGLDGAAYGTHTGMWPLIDFPLKWCVTSIKFHPWRGTGTVFAITAAVEAIVARDLSRWTNLSEQFLYCKGAAEFHPADWGWPLTGSDGVSIHMMLAHMSAWDGLTPRFVYPFESSWDYNRSPARIYEGGGWKRSCWGSDTLPPYAGEYCSDASHQAPMYNAVDQWGNLYCAYLIPVPVPGDAGFRVVDPYCLGDAQTLPLNVVRASLALKVPVMLYVLVPANMGSDHVDGSGVVPYPPYNAHWGWHHLLLVGYVANAHLPPGTPPGDGGGYFVAKQSWGPEYGDGGYCYLSDDWVKARGMSCWTLDVEDWVP